MMLVDALQRMGVGLNEEERAKAHSRDKTVEIKAVETSITQNLASSGKAPEEIAMTLGVLKQVGALMAGGGIAQGDDKGVVATAAPTPNMPQKTNDLPDF